MYRGYSRIFTSRTRTAAKDAGMDVLAAALVLCASASIARCTSSQMSCCCFLQGGLLLRLGCASCKYTGILKGAALSWHRPC